MTSHSCQKEVNAQAEGLEPTLSDPKANGGWPILSRNKRAEYRALRRASAFVFALLVVIPEGDLLLSLLLGSPSL